MTPKTSDRAVRFSTTSTCSGGLPPATVNPSLRPGRDTDAPRIAELQLASWRVTYTAELSAAFLARQTTEAWTEHWRGRIANGENLILAEDATALVGFVACGPARVRSVSTLEWQIYNIHVAPGRHGEGIGGMLFQATAALGRSRGARQLMVWVVETNHNARAFYEALRMRCDGAAQENHKYEEVLHEVRYRVDL